MSKEHLKPLLESFGESTSIRVPSEDEMRRKCTWLGKVVTPSNGRRRYVVTYAHCFGGTDTKEGTISYMIAALSGGDAGSHSSGQSEDDIGRYWKVAQDQEIVFSGKDAHRRKSTFDNDMRQGKAPYVYDAGGSVGKHIVAYIVMKPRATRTEGQKSVTENSTKSLIQKVGGKILRTLEPGHYVVKATNNAMWRLGKEDDEITVAGMKTLSKGPNVVGSYPTGLYIVSIPGQRAEHEKIVRKIDASGGLKEANVAGKTATKSGEELDVVTKAPLKYLDRPGVKKDVKKALNKRGRQDAKRDIDQRVNEVGKIGPGNPGWEDDEKGTCPSCDSKDVGLMDLGHGGKMCGDCNKNNASKKESGGWWTNIDRKPLKVKLKDCNRKSKSWWKDGMTVADVVRIAKEKLGSRLTSVSVRKYGPPEPQLEVRWRKPNGYEGLEATFDLIKPAGLKEAKDEDAAFHKKLLHAQQSPAKQKELGLTQAQVHRALALMGNGMGKEDVLYALSKSKTEAKSSCRNCGCSCKPDDLRNGNCRKCDAEINRPDSVPPKDFTEAEPRKGKTLKFKDQDGVVKTAKFDRVANNMPDLSGKLKDKELWRVIVKQPEGMDYARYIEPTSVVESEEKPASGVVDVDMLRRECNDIIRREGLDGQRSPEQKFDDDILKRLQQGDK